MIGERFLQALRACSPVRGLLLFLLASGAAAATLEVPAQHATIQAAIDAASDGDVVLVAPGTYVESLSLAGKTVTLASHFFTTGDPSFIDQTVIDGGGAAQAIFVDDTVGAATTIVGFTIQDTSAAENDGIRVDGSFQLLDSRITGFKDGIDYSGGGGLVRNCVLEGNTDDGIDLDNDVAVLIEENEIIDNGFDTAPDGDGIEIRLQDYQGPTLEIVIRNNRIEGNEADGIQLIDYDVATNRVFRIEGNTFANNGDAAIGMMCCQQSDEDFEGASLLERVYITNNTFVGHDHGITGGDNNIILNNLFVSTTNIALKRADGSSIAAYNLFWQNGTDWSESNVEVPTTLQQDPLLDADLELLPGSPAIDAGTAFYEHLGEVVLDLPPSAYAGSAPDLGAFEVGGGGPTNAPPSVDAGPDQVLPSQAVAVLDGTVTDDGLPAGTLAIQWSPVSGPGTVSFGDELAEDTTATFSADGTYVLRLSADDSDLVTTDDVEITLTPEAGILDLPVASGADDAEEAVTSGSVDLSSPTLELAFDPVASENQVVGLRWDGVGIPPGKQITAAWVQFQAGAISQGPASLEIRGELASHAAPFSEAVADLSGRLSTSALAAWNPADWNAVGEADLDQQTPDLSAIVGEIVGDPGWQEGNALALFFTGSGTRVAEAFEGAPGASPVLHVAFAPLPPQNQAPAVDAGPDQKILLPQAISLVGMVSDDGLPAGQGLSFLWTQESGPGVVSIASPADLATSAQFSEPGVYVLRLTADDGELAAFDEMRVAVAREAPTGVLDAQVTDGANDAEEAVTDGNISLGSSDLEMAFDPGSRNDYQVVGLRFPSLAVPAGAIIVTAWVQFQTDETDLPGPANLLVAAEDSDDAAPFQSVSGDLSSRATTSTAVPWNPPEWNTVGEAGPDQQTAELASVIQEVVDRAGWAPGNALALLITGTGTRTAESYDGDPAGAPKLHVEYGTGAPACADGIDNDGDGTIDFGEDAGCASESAELENPDCSDGIDNDGDELTDFPADAGCSDASDQSELSPPLVAITAPPDASTVGEGLPVTFTGTASDTEDGDLSASLAWSSNLDGALGTGASVVISTLSAGVHTISASVTDSGGDEGTAQITLTVNATPPLVPSLSMPALVLLVILMMGSAVSLASRRVV